MTVCANRYGLSAPDHDTIRSMASRSSVPACIDKEKLLQDFAKAVSEHHRMQSAQVAAVLRGEDFLFEDEIIKAAERRENAKYAVLKHRQEHGC